MDSIDIRPGDLVKSKTKQFLSWGSVEDATQKKYYVDEDCVLLVTRVVLDVTYEKYFKSYKYLVYEMLHNGNIVSCWIDMDGADLDDSYGFDKIFEKYLG